MDHHKGQNISHNIRNSMDLINSLDSGEMKQYKIPLPNNVDLVSLEFPSCATEKLAIVKMANTLMILRDRIVAL